MGKNKKGKGAEKTAVKTEKKLSRKQKKELAELGEDDVEKIVAQIEQEEQHKKAIVETTIDKPIKRSNFAFVTHPEKDELILFGGEFYNGQKTVMYNDLLFYNINKGEWSCLKSPGSPAPRSGHQMVAVPGNKGQLWVFGGEYASPSQSQFYHYKDLWVFHLAERKWEKINVAGGPTARSGHRMVLHKKQLILFGGYHDNTYDFKYFNDIYAFDMKDYKWRKLEPIGTPPAPRSACQMVTLPNGKILVSGGYSKVKVKKDVDKGFTHTDIFLLTPDKGDETGLKWKWVSSKASGVSPFPRSGMAFTSAPGNKIMVFGGVRDEEGEEDLVGTFHNDLYSLDSEKIVWRTVTLSGKKDSKPKRRRRKEGQEEGDGEEEEGEEEEEVEPEPMEESRITSDDGIFQMTVGPSPVSAPSGQTSNTNLATDTSVFFPSPRMNAGLAVKQGRLYLYGGIFEDGDRQYTLSDMYSLDLHKLDEWKTIVASDTTPEEWLESESGSEESGDEEDDGEDDEEESPMETD